MEYGLIGDRLGHSFSKVIHESIMDYKYDLVELDENEFVEPVWLTEDEVNNFLKEPDAAIIQQLAWKCL